MTDEIRIPISLYRYRVLFSDGETADFLAHSDNSDIRGQMLEIHFGKERTKTEVRMIVGIIRLTQVGEVNT